MLLMAGRRIRTIHSVIVHLLLPFIVLVFPFGALRTFDPLFLLLVLHFDILLLLLLWRLRAVYTFSTTIVDMFVCTTTAL